MEVIKKILVIFVLCSFILGTIPISVLALQNSIVDQILEYEGPDLPDGVEYVPGEFIVKFKPGVSNWEIAIINSRYGTSVNYVSPYAGFMILQIPIDRSVPDMVEIFNKNPNVDYAVVNSIAHAFMDPDDQYYDYQWNFNNSVYGGINMGAAWDISDGTGVTVAVLDSGVAYEDYGIYEQAPDLANTNFVAGWDFVNNDAHPNDDNSHGTHVTGTIAQSTNNGIGVAGVAYNCNIMPVKVLNRRGSGNLDQLVDGIHYATDNGADIISMSLGWTPGYDPGQPLKDALDYAYNEGVTIVCASGNDATSQVGYPAAYEKCIAVGATRFDETRASYSNYGSDLDIMAPGGDLTVDQNGDGYGDGILQQTFRTNSPTKFDYYFYQGTSMATPHVSGVAALLIANGITGPDNIREVLCSTAEDKGDPGWDSEYGWGIVDAYAALQWTPEDDPVNNLPVAEDDTYSVKEDTSLFVDKPGVLGNDTDDDNDLLTAVLVSGVSYGELTLNSDGSFNYDPNDDFAGTDSFTYKAYDGISYSNTATVNIVVEPVNDAPIAYDQTVTTQEGIAVDIYLEGSDVDGDELDYIINSGPSHGTLSGEVHHITYTPESSYTGEDSFTFKVNDGKTDSDPATVSITVTEKETMNIKSVDVSFIQTRKAGNNFFGYAIAEVIITDGSDGPVASATVSGVWSSATTDSDSGNTDDEGIVSFNSDTAKVVSGTQFNFTVTNVACGGYRWNNEEVSGSTTVEI